MGFGILNKCVMQWHDEDAMVWPEDVHWFEMITPSTHTSGQWTTFSNPSKFKGVPMLVGWIGANYARLMETQTDKEIVDDVMKHLHNVLVVFSVKFHRIVG